MNRVRDEAVTVVASNIATWMPSMQKRDNDISTDAQKSHLKLVDFIKICSISALSKCREQCLTSGCPLVSVLMPAKTFNKVTV